MTQHSMPSNATATAPPPPPPPPPPPSLPKILRRSGLSLLRVSSSNSSSCRRRRGGDDSRTATATATATTTTPANAPIAATGMTSLDGHDVGDHEENDDDDDDGGGGCDGEEEEDDDDGDPLLSLFRAHNTNRVKFDLDHGSDDGANAPTANVSVDGAPRDGGDGGGGGGIGSSATNASARLRKRLLVLRRVGSGGGIIASSSPFRRPFSKTTTATTTTTTTTATTAPLLKKSRSSPPASNVDDFDNGEEEAYVGRMLEPPTPLRRMGSFLESKLGLGSSDSCGGGGRSGRGGGIGGIGGVRRRRRAGDDDDDRLLGGAPASAKEMGEYLAGLIGKAHVAHRRTFRYRLAMRYYLLALREMTTSGRYENDDHPLTVHVMKCLNDVHHAQSTLTNSADIVRMGMQHEDNDMHVRALRMYTIAHRMRRDVCGPDHPSLSVLLNMMGSVRVKRGEYDEAMRMYEASLLGGVEGGSGKKGGSGGCRRGGGGGHRRNPLTTR